MSSIDFKDKVLIAILHDYTEIYTTNIKTMIKVYNDEHFMKVAFEQAQIAAEKEEVPVGAVIVQNDHIIAKAHNQTEQLNDATAHAEMLAITAAMENLSSKYLDDCTLYITLEPCVMCGGAIEHAHIKKIVYGASDPKKGVLQYQPSIFNKKVTLIGGILETECSEILRDFFKKKR